MVKLPLANIISIVGTALIVTFVATFLVRQLALRWGIVDRPETAPDRKIHKTPTAMLGGAAIFIGLSAAIFIWRATTPLAAISFSSLLALFLASAVLQLGGVLDDWRRLSPGQQIFWPLLASLIAVAGGIGVNFVSNPLGGVIWLDQVKFGIFGLTVTLWSALFTVVWLMVMMYTTKLLDGLDGLVSGVTAIGGLIIALVSLRPEVDQPGTALVALALSASCLGFLPWNWHPAKIFLGEGGSLLTGFFLGALAIISGGKIATALLILGLPVLDVIWVVVRRSLIEGRSPFRSSDRKHLHFRLLDVGLSPRQSVLVLYTITAVFGATAVFVHGQMKLVALGFLILLMCLLGAFLVRRSKRLARPGSVSG